MCIIKNDSQSKSFNVFLMVEINSKAPTILLFFKSTGPTQTRLFQNDAYCRYIPTRRLLISYDSLISRFIYHIILPLFLKVLE